MTILRATTLRGLPSRGTTLRGGILGSDRLTPPVVEYPVSLFASGEEGAVYTFAPGTVFTDSAFTTAASPGDPVGGVRDISGNGNHLVQTASANRPTYTLEDGCYWLTFDGANHSMQSAATMDMSGSTDVSVVSGIYTNPAGAGTSRMILTHGDGAGKFFTQILASDLFYIYSQGATNARVLNIGTAQQSAYSIFHAQAGTDPGNILCTINQGTDNTNAIAQGGGARDNDTLYLGAASSGSSLWRGSIGPTTFINRALTVDEVAALEAWTADRTPNVTL